MKSVSTWRAPSPHLAALEDRYLRYSISELDTTSNRQRLRAILRLDKRLSRMNDYKGPIMAVNRDISRTAVRLYHYTKGPKPIQNRADSS